MKFVTRRQRSMLAIAMAIALLASLALGSASGLAVVEQEALQNGNFEGGFTSVSGCGSVGAGWGCFTNGGTASYGFFDDQWGSVVADGAHSQLITISTKQYAASEPNRYAGIYQTVPVVRGATYQLKMQGLIREVNPNSSEDAFRYRVQWGYTSDGSTDWGQVTNWAELPWDKIESLTSSSGLQSFSTTLTAPSDKITLFVRLWKKWGTAYREVSLDLDAISLFGSSVQISRGVVLIPPTGSSTTPPVIIPSQPAACGGPSLVANGNFEGGFTSGVGNSWAGFNNGGQANYGFGDDQWASVVKDGAHSQLIVISTKGLAASNNDRYAGIYQTVSGLVPGASYQFALTGLMTEETAHPNEDAFRYRVQWGYAAAGASPNDISNWTELSWDTIYARSAPGAMASYSAQFNAPSNAIVLAVRAWKKWGTPGREFSVDLDTITLTPCGAGGGVVVIPPSRGVAVQCLTYTVAQGDTLSGIAAKYRDTAAGIAARNNLANANLIYAGQILTVCDP